VLGAGGGVAAFVGAGVVSGAGAGLSPQPVINEPITNPNSTIRVDSLFIVAVTLTESQNLTSKKNSWFSGLFRTIANASSKQVDASLKVVSAKSRSAIESPFLGT